MNRATCNGTPGDCGKTGFTIIELLVVLALFALTAAIGAAALRYAIEEGRRSACLNNLRQMVTAAYLYAANHDGRFPPGMAYEQDGNRVTLHAWDFSTSRDWDTGTQQVKPGLLWQGAGDLRVQQCPSFCGESNWDGDPYTGYNYNVSYVGHGMGETITTPIRTSEIRNPSNCVLFGDGEWAGGANKFMRSPRTAPGDAAFSGRYAGTQGFRHRGYSNVAFADGRAESRRDRHEGPYGNLPDHIGFLSDDNSLYDLY